MANITFNTQYPKFEWMTANDFAAGEIVIGKQQAVYIVVKCKDISRWHGMDLYTQFVSMNTGQFANKETTARRMFNSESITLTQKKKVEVSQ